MNQKRILILLILGIAGYLAYAKYTSPWRPANVNEVTLDLVRKKLKDPASAQFKDVYQATAAICGQVNAKNTFGGYTGFKRFYVTKAMDGRVSPSSRVLIEQDGDVKEFDELYQLMCPQESHHD